MNTGPISELVVPYDPGPLAEKVARRRRLVQSRLVSLAITVAVLLLIYLWRREDLEGGVFIVLYALILGISLALLGAAVFCMCSPNENSAPSEAALRSGSVRLASRSQA